MLNTYPSVNINYDNVFIILISNGNTNVFFAAFLGNIYFY